MVEAEAALEMSLDDVIQATRGRGSFGKDKNRGAAATESGGGGKGASGRKKEAGLEEKGSAASSTAGAAAPSEASAACLDMSLDEVIQASLPKKGKGKKGTGKGSGAAQNGGGSGEKMSEDWQGYSNASKWSSNEQGGKGTAWGGSKGSASKGNQQGWNDESARQPAPRNGSSASDWSNSGANDWKGWSDWKSKPSQQSATPHKDSWDNSSWDKKNGGGSNGNGNASWESWDRKGSSTKEDSWTGKDSSSSWKDSSSAKWWDKGQDRGNASWSDSAGGGGQKRRHNEKEPNDDRRKQIKVKNIPEDLDWRDIKSAFEEEAGPIVRCELERGTAWITFTRPEDARAAVETLDRGELNGATIEVTLQR